VGRDAEGARVSLYDVGVWLRELFGERETTAGICILLIACLALADAARIERKNRKP
jgi:hypothetical protein